MHSSNAERPCRGSGKGVRFSNLSKSPAGYVFQAIISTANGTSELTTIGTGAE